jgi:hypothetical protein
MQNTSVYINIINSFRSFYLQFSGLFFSVLQSVCHVMSQFPCEIVLYCHQKKSSVLDECCLEICWTRLLHPVEKTSNIIQNYNDLWLHVKNLKMKMMLNHGYCSYQHKLKLFLEVWIPNATALIQQKCNIGWVTTSWNSKIDAVSAVIVFNQHGLCHNCVQSK